MSHKFIGATLYQISRLRDDAEIFPQMRHRINAKSHAGYDEKITCENRSWVYIDSGLLKKAKKSGRKVPRIAMVFAAKELDDNWARLLIK